MIGRPMASSVHIMRTGVRGISSSDERGRAIHLRLLVAGQLVEQLRVDEHDVPVGIVLSNGTRVDHGGGTHPAIDACILMLSHHRMRFLERADGALEW